jgi:hypothetical protein
MSMLTSIRHSVYNVRFLPNRVVIDHLIVFLSKKAANGCSEVVGSRQSIPGWRGVLYNFAFKGRFLENSLTVTGLFVIGRRGAPPS